MTTHKALKDAIKNAPKPFDTDAVQQFRDGFGPAFGGLGADARALVEGVAGCAPYLRRLMLASPALTVDILNTTPAQAVAGAMRDARAAAALDNTPAQLAALRHAKSRAALAIALADIAGYWPVMEAAAQLSRFADSAVDAALTAAMNNVEGKTNGLSAIAMGKHGAYELNYSSDIDLVMLFDRKAMGVDDRGEAQAIAVRAVREMINLLNTQTRDGYVFRTDLRLRPDPGVTAAALSVEAAEAYYESYGQNWERAAFIKARAAAGDCAVGEKFLSALRPFVWRKYLDFAAIEDVHSIKRQIHAARGGGGGFFGHDVKLGRGGIREIEFYVQTQQLILGGKNPALRERSTLAALETLRAHGHVSDKAAHELHEAYLYLRNVEHRLQMINDEQTHKIPRDQHDAARIAMFLGEDDLASFQTRLGETLHCVHDHFSDLFNVEDQLAVNAGTLVFTGVDNHPATIETLEKLGFIRAGEVSAIIRRWHASGVRATRTVRARELLTKLIPVLLEALSKAGNPDDAFFAFNEFLSRLPAGVQIFSLLANNTDVFDALIRIMTISPYLGRELSGRLNFVERLVENRWTAPPPAPGEYAALLRAELDAAASYEGQLNAVRRWAGEQKFQIAAQLAVGIASSEAAAPGFTGIADAAIMALVPAVQEEMRRAHGAIDGGLVIAGLGRLGAGEMTATSDIDLIFIYDAPADAVSDGQKPLDATRYYARLVRRLVTALSAATEEGLLYEVDMQLRPSGRAGPAAVSLAAFERYYRDDAWTWEMMALTKARVISGDKWLCDKVGSEITAILKRPRLRESTAGDVASMRLKLANAKPPQGVWDVKQAAGGLTDIAFVTQFLGLVTAAQLGCAPRDGGAAIAWFEKHGELDSRNAEGLFTAHRLFETVVQVGRAATGGVFDPALAGQGLRERMASIYGAGSIEDAEAVLVQQQAEVARIAREVIGSRYESGGGPTGSMYKSGDGGRR